MKTLIGFSKTDIDILFIENSGMADPSSMHTLLDGMAGLTERPLVYKGAVCLVDAVNFLEDLDLFSPVQNQIATSHMILVNKADLADKEEIDRIHKAIAVINPEALVINTVQAYVAPEEIEAQLQVSDYVGETTNHPWNRPVTYTLISEAEVDSEDIERFARAIKSKVIRLKGFAKTKSGYCHISVVGNMVQVVPAVPANIDETTIVIIGRSSGDFSDTIAELWAEYVGTEMELEEF